jgi:hypothetical protein
MVFLSNDKSADNGIKVLGDDEFDIEGDDHIEGDLGFLADLIQIHQQERGSEGGTTASGGGDGRGVIGHDEMKGGICHYFFAHSHITHEYTQLNSSGLTPYIV